MCAFPTLEAVIPVTLDFDRSLLSFVGEAPAPGDQELRPRGGVRGLRAQLVAQSLVTGQLAVDLDFRPGGAPAAVSPRGEVLEIPAVPSDLQHLKDQVLELNLPQLAAKAAAALTSLQRILDGLDGKEGSIADAALQAMADARVTLQASTQARARLTGGRRPHAGPSRPVRGCRPRPAWRERGQAGRGAVARIGGVDTGGSTCRVAGRGGRCALAIAHGFGGVVA